MWCEQEAETRRANHAGLRFTRFLLIWRPGNFDELASDVPLRGRGPKRHGELLIRPQISISIPTHFSPVGQRWLKPRSHSAEGLYRHNFGGGF